MEKRFLKVALVMLIVICITIFTFLLGMVAGMVHAASEADLDTPQVESATATKIVNTKIVIMDDTVYVDIEWLAADDSVIKTERIGWAGADYTAFATTLVVAGDAGKTYKELLRTAVLAKVLADKGLTGTIIIQ